MPCLPRYTPNPSLRHMLNKTAVLSGLLGALLATPVFADESADVSKLFRAGQLAEVRGQIATAPMEVQTLLGARSFYQTLGDLRPEDLAGGKK